MYFKSAYLFISLILISNIVDSVKVSIYYESLCPDSADFILNQLLPTYSCLKDHMQLEFIPYGKASHNFINNNYYFACQHGIRECTGNIYQSCVFAQNYHQNTNVCFLGCVMQQIYPSYWLTERMKMCASNCNMNWYNIDQCAKSAQGNNLFMKNGDKTRKLMPQLSFVPTIVFNDFLNQYEQDSALNNFAGIVCGKIYTNRPEFCN